MGAAYTILGRTVQPHQLAIATLLGVVFIAVPKPWAPAAPAPTPSINASSPEEEKFIKEYLAKHLAEEKH
ncbi:ATP19 [[Candida] subhashii]|uniref:ATP19 n=1 Tax=[Candida] subhashii TaxID=561895 RepID=A0A8J5QG90_9ASCO|nr:ATP19 [[Candida] subhashii]KAG7660713.1 ATP19 [[Candida] subhashii]